MALVTARLKFIEPQLASSVDQPPEGKHWIHEIKHDGYRCQVLLERGQARVFTPNGHDWSDRYPSIVHAAANLRCKSAIIDGEAIVQDGNGASDFEALSSAMRWRPHNIILYAFDLMHLDEIDLRQRTLSVRRSLLKTLLGSDEESRIQFSEEFHGDGAAFFKACADKKLEGSLQTCTGTLSLWTQQDVAQDEMLHREHVRHHWHGPGSQDRSTPRAVGAG